MPVETRILDSIEGDIRCQSCGKFVRIGKGKTLGFWYEKKGRKFFGLICGNCEGRPDVKELLLETYPEQERV